MGEHVCGNYHVSSGSLVAAHLFTFNHTANFATVCSFNPKTRLDLGFNGNCFNLKITLTILARKWLQPQISNQSAPKQPGGQLSKSKCKTNALPTSRHSLTDDAAAAAATKLPTPTKQRQAHNYGAPPQRRERRRTAESPELLGMDLEIEQGGKRGTKSGRVCDR